MPVLGPQVLGEEHDKMYRHHHRNQTRLLPQETFEVSDSVPIPCYSHVLCGLVMWSSSNVRVCYVGYSFLTIITIRRYFFSSNLTCVGYSWYGLICESDLASVIFSKDDDDYLEPRLYQTCIWKKNLSLYRTKTDCTHFRVIGTNWLVIFSGSLTEDLIPEKVFEWPCRPALYSQCMAAFTQRYKITKLTAKCTLTPNVNEKMWQPRFKIHLVTKSYSRWEWVSQHIISLIVCF